VLVRVLRVHDHGRDGNDHVKQRRHTPEQVIRKLREADQMLGEGRSIAEVAEALEISEPTYHRWRNPYGGLKTG
jgi:transposase-like protein